jgi:hypothetical protein
VTHWTPVTSDDDGLAAHLEWLGALHDDTARPAPARRPPYGDLASPAEQQMTWADNRATFDDRGRGW